MLNCNFFTFHHKKNEGGDEICITTMVPPSETRISSDTISIVLKSYLSYIFKKLFHIYDTYLIYAVS